VIVAALGVGLATAAVASLSLRLQVSRWVVVGVLANPGVWLTLVLLTPDALALGLALSAVLLWWDHRYIWGTLVLALAALTKEQYLLVALSLGGYTWFRRKRGPATALILGSTTPLVLWSVWLMRTVNNGTILGGGLSLLGVLQALHTWNSTASVEQTLALLTVIGIATAVVLSIGATSLLRWLAWPWVGLALITSPAVWDFGSNAARVLAPVWVFSAMSLAVWVQSRHGAEVATEPL